MVELLEFTISHYCEKARWGLEYLGVPFRPVVVLPGPHIVTLRRLGLRRTTVPVLVTPDGHVQGSGAILDLAEAQASGGRSLLPQEPEARAAVLAWETRLDRDAGEALRRILYHHLLEKPAAVIDLWTQGGPWWGSPLYRAVFPLMAANLRRYYRIRPDRVAASQAVFDALADDLDAALAAGPWLVGDAFTRADLTAAALLAPLVMPDAHRVRWPASRALPAGAIAQRERYAERPFFRWVEDTYRTHRGA